MRARALALACVVLACAGAVIWVLTRAGRSGAPSASAARSSALVNQRGEPFALEQLRGKSVVLNFIFTHCPGICPLQTQALRRVRTALPDAVRERVHFLSVSVDPERDTPEALRAFAAQHGADLDHWTFVTGPARELRAVGESYSAQALPEGAGPLDHRTEIRLIDAQGRLMQTYTGNPLDEPRLAREIRAVDELFNHKASL